jgi:hypothetical protein
MVDLDRWSKFTTALQALVVSLAVLVGGAWTLYTFGTLGQIDRAQAELEQLQRNLRQRGILEIVMEATQLPVLNRGMSPVVVSVSVKNTGNRTEVLDWLKGGLWIAPVVTDASPAPSFGAQIRLPYTLPGAETPSSSILPGQTRKFPFLATLLPKRIYHLQFRVEVSPLEQKEHQSEHLLSSDFAYVWQAATYIAVR